MGSPDLATVLGTGETVRRRTYEAVGGGLSRQELLALLRDADDALLDLIRALQDEVTEHVLCRDALLVAEETIRERELQLAGARAQLLEPQGNTGWDPEKEW